MHKDELSKLLDIAVFAARQAGEFLTSSPLCSRTIRQEYAHDIKIEADHQSEKIILDHLSQESQLPTLSEEAGMQNANKGDLVWVVDPIDGSLNFERQIPVSCISIGLWQGQKPMLGVVYDFNRSELFSGIVSQGAWLNDAPIQVSQILNKDKAVLFSGFPAGMDLGAVDFEVLAERVRSYRKVRWIGSAALSMAYVACGRGDVYREEDIMFWDVAGGIPLVLAAGGLCRFDRSQGLYGYKVFASNGKIEFS